MKHRVRSAGAYERRDGFKVYRRDKESYTVKDVLTRTDITSPNSAADRLRRWEKGYLDTEQLFAPKDVKYHKKPPTDGADSWEGLSATGRSGLLD